MKQRKPNFHAMWQHFSTVNKPVAAVGAIIGGKVQQNIQMATEATGQGFRNACAIRLSYALHHNGVIIATNQQAWRTSSGADKRQYIFRVDDLRAFLLATFGKPDKVLFHPQQKDLLKMRGIVIFTRRFADATGHATLWDGQQCADHCYFDGAAKIEIWLLT